MRTMKMCPRAAKSCSEMQKMRLKMSFCVPQMQCIKRTCFDRPYGERVCRPSQLCAKSKTESVKLQSSWLNFAFVNANTKRGQNQKRRLAFVDANVNVTEGMGAISTAIFCAFLDPLFYISEFKFNASKMLRAHVKCINIFC